MQQEVLLSILKQTNLPREKLGFISAPIKPVQQFYALVPKINPQAVSILNVINSGFTELKVSGNYQRILNNYLGTND